jgi:cyclase
VSRLLESGADKISVNSAAMANPGLVDDIAGHFGSQVCVISVDAKRDAGMPSGYVVTTHGGRKSAGRDGLAWAIEACERGAGELLLNSIDADGTKKGFDVEMLEAFRSHISVPLVASGGAGTAPDGVAAYLAGADAILAASIFHHDKVEISEVKQHLRDAGATVR